MHLLQNPVCWVCQFIFERFEYFFLLAHQANSYGFAAYQAKGHGGMFPYLNLEYSVQLGDDKGGQGGDDKSL